MDELPLALQAGAFVGIYALLGAATSASVRAVDALSSSAAIGLERWRGRFVETSLPLALGAFYLAAGAGHFVDAGAFAAIVPPDGTWGVWRVPGSAEFHVAWTGAAEVLGGGGLAYGGLRSVLGAGGEEEDESWPLKLLRPASAGALFLLTILVTPANIYMYTHGATMGEGMGALDLSFHYFRFGLQVLLLSLLFVLAKDSLFFAWGDELD